MGQEGLEHGARLLCAVQARPDQYSISRLEFRTQSEDHALTHLAGGALGQAHDAGFGQGDGC